MTFPPRTSQGWDEWFDGFKRRHPEQFPSPPPDAPPPPPDPRIPDDREEDQP